MMEGGTPATSKDRLAGARPSTQSRAVGGTPAIFGRRNATTAKPLCLAKSSHRIQFRCAPGGDVVGDKSNEDEENRDGRECERISRPHPVEHARHQLGNNQGTNKPTAVPVMASRKPSRSPLI